MSFREDGDLALGFVASAAVVVPTFTQLLHGNELYLAVTSTLGVIATVAGIQMLVSASSTGLAIVMIAMVLMWLLATTHHYLAGRHPAAVGARRI